MHVPTTEADPPAQAHEDVLARLRTMLTKHAAERMRMRGVHPGALAATIAYGRLIHTRGADILAIGRKEVERYRREGIDLSRHEGLQAVLGEDGAVVTVYRNRDFRGLRPRYGRRIRRRARVRSRH